jgi:CRP/FNR family transcriptional regulator, cyclic AMP receptor protein
MSRKVRSTPDAKALMAAVGETAAPRAYRKGQPIFVQGERGDAVFFVQQGKVKVTVLSPQGKQAVIALLGPGDFFGEGCLAGQPVRMATAIALMECSIVRLAKPTMIQALQRDSVFAGLFTTYLLSRNIRMEEDLVDQLFNSSEKRLARILLLLANFGKEGRPEPVVPKISQETLAEMVGTTRSRISHFMNKFRRLGFVEYNGGLQVHTSLLHVVLHD